MQPDETRPTTPIVVPQSQSAVPGDTRDTGAEAAANIVRGQIDQIYASDPNHIQVVHSERGNIQLAHQQNEATNPYARTHGETEHQVHANTWQKYHSAWQSYYQQYYERYYVSQVHATKKHLESQFGAPQEQSSTMSTDEAMYDLRSRLRQQISSRAKKVRKSRHFTPIISAFIVMGIFAFLQYNRVIFATVEAYIIPSNSDSEALLIDPSASRAVGPDPKLIIPKIGVEVPIVWDANAADQNSLNKAMDKGVAWFNIRGANARPGEVGNFVLSGHSSNDWLDQGPYKFIFVRLEQMKVGDTIYVNYEGIRYTYEIKRTRVVKPTEVSALTEPTDKPILTLITCTPIGTALNRLLVFAEQVDPDPGTASTTTSSTESTDTEKMPANSPTFFERIFGIGD